MIALKPVTFRRIVTIAAAGLFVAVFRTIGSAQEIGVKVGDNFASLTMRPSDPVDHLWQDGEVAGVWVRTRPRGRVSFQVEGLFSEKGLLQREIFIDAYLSDFRIRYIELPLLARVDFAQPDAKYRLHLIAGAAPAFQIGARYRDEFPRGGTGIFDISDSVARFDIGGVAGAGLDLRRFLVEARYTHGLRSVFKAANEMGLAPSVRNRTIGVLFGFRFR